MIRMGGEAGGSACFISIWESAARRSTAEALVGANSCLHEVAGALKFQGHILPRAMFFVAFPRCFGRWLLCNCLLGRARGLLPMLAALLILGVCHGDEPLAFPTLTTKQGVTYQAVKVTRFDAVELHFSHAKGVATVRLADLPAEVQEIFGYDPRNESVVMTAKQRERAQAIIQEADKKAKAAAALEQERADAAELKNIRDGMLRCFVKRVVVSAEALLADVAPADKLPVILKSKRGKYERVKLTPQGKPELMEQVVPGQTFVLGETIRVLPQSAPVTADGFISVYLIATDVGEHALCALTP